LGLHPQRNLSKQTKPNRGGKEKKKKKERKKKRKKRKFGRPLWMETKSDFDGTGRYTPLCWAPRAAKVCRVELLLTAVAAGWGSKARYPATPRVLLVSVPTALRPPTRRRLGNASVSIRALQSADGRHERGEPIRRQARGGYLSVHYLSHRFFSTRRPKSEGSRVPRSARRITPG